jgi:hypothetical protein
MIDADHSNFISAIDWSVNNENTEKGADLLLQRLENSGVQPDIIQPELGLMKIFCKVPVH